MTKAKETKTSMTRDEFWAEVARIGWGTKTTDYKKVKRELMRKGREFCKELERHYDEVDKALLDAGCDLHGGDSVGDCRSHIIGLGKEEYDKVMADQSVGEQRYRDGDYREKFSYCFPYDHDWEKFDLEGDWYTKWAKKNLRGYRADKARLAKFAALPQVQAILDEIDKVIELHRPLLADKPDFAEFVASGGVLKDAAEKAEKLFKKLIADLTGNTGRWDDKAESAIDNKWGIWNLVSDVKEAQSFWDGE